MQEVLGAWGVQECVFPCVCQLLLIATFNSVMLCLLTTAASLCEQDALSGTETGREGCLSLPMHSCIHKQHTPACR